MTVNEQFVNICLLSKELLSQKYEIILTVAVHN